MSAFLVEDKTINLVADLLCYGHHLDGLLEAKMPGAKNRELASKLKRMNLDAMITRYPDKWPELTGIDSIEIDENHEMIPGFTVCDKEAHPFNESLAQKYKHVQCFLYQCDEGDNHLTDLFKRVESLKDDLKNSIITNLPAYQEASWE